MYALHAPIMPYAWGSRRALAELMRRPAPSAEPEAELWMGAHPRAPARVVIGAAERALDELIASEPEAWLGSALVERFGPRLPFLMKVLAAETPLSLQAHPSHEQAELGFAREEAQGIARDARERNYRDASAKPELLCALTPFSALCGFRPIDEARELLRQLAVPELAFLEAALSSPSDPLRDAFTRLMTLAENERAAAVRATVQACQRLSREPFAADAALAVRLAELYPDDAGVISSLLLNHVELLPGQALYLDAGQLHSYVGGVGVEIMASSDNVLRGGLTPKHVDVPELLSVLEFSSRDPAPLKPAARGAERVYPTPAPEFCLSQLKLGGRFDAELAGPELLLCTQGEVRADSASGSLVLRSGDSAVVPARDRAYSLFGQGVVFRARTGAIV